MHSGGKASDNTVIRIPMIKNMTPFVDAGGIFTLEIIRGLAQTGKFKIKSGAPGLEIMSLLDAWCHQKIQKKSKKI